MVKCYHNLGREATYPLTSRGAARPLADWIMASGACNRTVEVVETRLPDPKSFGDGLLAGDECNPGLLVSPQTLGEKHYEKIGLAYSGLAHLSDRAYRGSWAGSCAGDRYQGGEADRPCFGLDGDESSHSRRRVKDQGGWLGPHHPAGLDRDRPFELRRAAGPVRLSHPHVPDDGEAARQREFFLYNPD